MSSCKPYGDPTRATVFIIGHDPSFQRSKTEAQHPFFLDYLESPRPSAISEIRKYKLALSAYLYIKELTGGSASLEDMYFTNLCNEFLRRTSAEATILIPDHVADRGISEICSALGKGFFKVILPMSLQVFYHLVRAGFVTKDPYGNLPIFLRQSIPNPRLSEKHSYKAAGGYPFLLVCGSTYCHERIPIVPILHVRQWSQRVTTHSPYYPCMQNAALNIRKALGVIESDQSIEGKSSC